MDQHEDAQEVIVASPVKAREAQSKRRGRKRKQTEPQAEVAPRPDRDAVYKNISRCKVAMFGSMIPVGGTHELTEDNKNNAIGMLKLERLIEFGFIQKVEA